MANIFVSYNRESEAITKTLVNDIIALGHTTWFDQELSGGQAWWDQILERVRNCDVFVFVLNPEGLSSTACKLEYGYAADLGKTILPVLVSGEVSTNLLPPALSQIQFVDYQKRDRDAGFRLAKALSAIPPPQPLLNTLPAPPEAPISYLGSFTEQVETTSNLSYEEQSALVVNLKRSFRDLATTEDTRMLLERLRNRLDLFATIAEEIDELLGSTIKATKASPRASEKEQFPKRLQKQETPLTQADSKPLGRQERMTGALFGALWGTAVGVLVMVNFNANEWWLGLLTGAGGTISGALSGRRRQVIVPVLLSAAVGWFLVAIFWGSNVAKNTAAGGVFGAPLGAIFGAIAGLILRKRKNW